MLLSELTKEQHLARVHAARLARVRLLTFCHLNNPDPQCIWDVTKSRYQWRRHHSHMARAIERLVNGELLNLEIETPPRVSKSELSVRNLVPWMLGRFPDKSGIIVTATDGLAQEHGRDVRDYMNGPGFKLVFGHDPRAQLKSDVQSTTMLQVRGGGKVMFTGRGGLPAGVGGHWIVFDDFFKSAEEANSEAERSKAWRSFIADCQSRRNDDKSWILMIGSRKHEDDVQGRLFDPMNPHYDENEAKKWTRIRLPALAEKDDPLGRAVDEPLWPEKFGYEHYNAKRNHASPVVRIDFQTQDQCKPVPEEGNYFKKEWLKTWRPGGPIDLPRDGSGKIILARLRAYGASDHALRKKQVNDSTCLGVSYVDPADRIFITPETDWRRMATDVMVERMLDLMSTFNTDMWWAARDQISGSIEPFLRKRQREREVFRPWDDSISEIVDLIQRARSIQARMAMGMVYFPSHAEWWGEAEAQLLAFPNGKFDDFVAMLAILGMGLDRMVKPAGAKSSDLPKKGTFAYHSYGQNQQQSTNTAGWV